MSSTATSTFNTFFGMARIVVPADLRSLFEDEYPKFTDYEGQACVEICHSYYPIINDEVYSRTLYSIYHLHNPEATRCFFDAMIRKPCRAPSHCLSWPVRESSA